ncbi:response regulator transcription factor [Dactylosporangium fulvum]|uniref:Response regulator transcription factor n=1 Tax=Dactylosporangium fulvum TaxID=53359 RepID=A0ABY5VS88_9ACTN|nr:response regulator transcription factor [Dactylosporangium fulvum]UWP79681.1 response regulator transcription factor [Dactylosporangium fulvum]
MTRSASLTQTARAGRRSRAVLVIDDHRVFTDVLSFALDAQPDLRCVAVAHSARDALATAAHRGFDVAIVDLQLPDGTGLDVVHELRALRPDAQLIVLTGHPRPGLAEQARDAGADALLAKDDALRSVLDVIRGTEPPDETAGGAPVPVPRLSPREREVLTLLATGAHAGQIAGELDLSVHTVRDYVKAILSKLGAHSQLDAVAAADRLGLIVRADRFR